MFEIQAVGLYSRVVKIPLAKKGTQTRRLKASCPLNLKFKRNEKILRL